jgi:hypothetical protein
MLAAEAGEHGARARRAHLLVGIDQHGQKTVVAEAHRLEHGDRVEDERDALLVVGDRESISAIAIDPERLFLQHAAQVDGVHVGDQHDLPGAGPLELGVHHGARLFRRVVHPVDVGRLDDRDLAAHFGQPFGDQRRQLRQPLGILAAGFDVDEVAQRIEQRRLFLLRQFVDARYGLAARGRGRQGEGEGKCEMQRGVTEHSGPFPRRPLRKQGVHTP